MKRFWPLVLVMCGFGLLLEGFIYDVLFAGIPYQDPTPEMSASHLRHTHIAAAICWAGMALLLVGLSGFVVRFVRLSGKGRPPRRQQRLR